MDVNEEKKLSDCLNSIINLVDKVLTQLRSKDEPTLQAAALEAKLTSQPLTTVTSTISNDPLFDNSVQNNNVNTFTVDITEEELLNSLTIDIQNNLKRRLPLLSKLCRSYVEQFLHEYHFNKGQQVFTEGLTASILYTFQQNLRGLLAAAKAYPAALNGDLATVKEFLQLYSHYKDKSGFWGTTLLWSAARKGHFGLVKYLIETACCSVNAQNQSDITYVLITDNDTARPNFDTLGYNPDPKAASTALHAACYSNNIEIVKYLIDKGANYFLRNQLGETPIQNGQDYPSIRQYFEDYLIRSYVNTPNTSIPNETILDSHVRKPNNCIWEYKPVKGPEWEAFTISDHNTLSTSLMPVMNDQSFNTTVYLSARESTYTVNLLTFLRGAKNQDPNPSPKDSQAWIRCRGSSIANFDIHCVWQLMFVRHDRINQPKTSTQLPPPSLQSSTIPSVYDSKFQIKLHSWYTCDSQLNGLLDETMNYRRRYVDIDNDYVGHVKCNLYTFSFANDKKTILGFIRWIPKFIANTPANQNFIKELDNFQPINQLNPIPLTIKRLEQSIRSKSMTRGKKTQMDDDEPDPMDHLSIVEIEADDDDDDSDQSTRLVTNTGTWNVADLISNEFDHHAEDDNEIPTTTVSITVPDIPTNANEYIDKQMSPPMNQTDKVILKQVSKANNRAEQDDAVLKARSTWQTENEQLKKKVFGLERQMSEQLRNLSEHDQLNQELINSTINTLEDTQRQLKEKEEHEKLINETAEQMSVVEYTLPKSNQSIITILHLIREVLKKLDYPHREYFKHSAPVIDIHDRNDYTLALKGFPIHHEKMKLIFERLQDLFNRAQAAEHFCEQQTNTKVRSLINTIERIRPKNPIYWRHYRDSLIKLIGEMCDDYIGKFKTYMNEELKKLLNICIESSSLQYRREVGTLANNFIRTEKFESKIEVMKRTALDEFIRDHVLFQQKSTKTIPSKDSVSALNKHIDKIKRLLTTHSDYKGYELKHFKMIVSLLQRIMIYYNCFLLQLPLFNASIDLLNKLENSTVLTIQTSTGSGKSTLLPALLVAEGYDKIIVTQPRRLPCTSISQRVNSMVNDDISGWAVSGNQENVQAKIVYVTDGLLKERLLNDESLITKNTTLNKSAIFFIDEVHERSVNIDLCLALFARLLKLDPDLKTKMKMIISSATLDASVPTLFKNIPRCSLTEFNLTSLSTLYKVTTIPAPDKNILDLVQELYSKRIRNEQILCFVSSTQEANENCKLLKTITRGAIIAYPLVQSQSAIDQQKYIEQGTVFFSTTVAETSLTFPCLKYVVDTGLINMPVYNLQIERTELTEIKAAESTTKQRRGRLGRTQPGEYYPLYNYGPGEQRKYPKPQICQSELVNIEFTLRKSRLRTSLVDFKQYLPDKPDQEYIDDAIKQLQRLGLISYNANERFTELGASLAKLPDFSSLPMAKAVYSALKKYHCGGDLIILSSILSILNTSAILKSIPVQYKCPEGDFMTLLKVMNTVLSDQNSVGSDDFKVVKEVCNAKGLSSITHVLKQALGRYKSLKRAFNLSDEFRVSAQVKTGNWENIAKALLEGFSDKVFVSQKILQGKAQQFLKYHKEQRAPNQPQPSSDEISTIAVINRSSTLRTGNKVVPASLILARDVLYLTAVRSTAILSFVGKIELAWLEYTFTRDIKLSETEQQKFNDENLLQKASQQFPYVDMHINNNKLVFRGPSGQVLNAELFIRQQLVTTLKFTLPEKSNDNLTRNLKTVTKMPIDLFGPLRWRWEAEQQVKVRTKMNPKKGTIDVTVEGLDSQNQAVKKEFISFEGWLNSCAVIRDPHSGVSPRLLKSHMRDEYRDMEEKINKITDPNRTSVDRWKSLKGPKATRESRMEVVAWVAVCLFDCRLEGGFVRDWVVSKDLPQRPNLPPQQWVEFSNGLPVLNRALVPSDLDCHLPPLKKFDVDSFVDVLYGYGISAEVFRQDWRYVLLMDKLYKTGPFTMDLIEPHIALTHDRIDFDVSNLSLEKSYTRDLGMRVDITRGPHPIQLETIVDNIREKQFQVLRPIDGENGPNTAGTVAQRIGKMKSRGWTQIGEVLDLLPDPPLTYNAILVPYPSSTTLYRNVLTAMQKIPGADRISIERIKNPDIESLYENLKRTIAKECPGNDPNERELFHGTHGDAIEGIINKGYDDRYFSPDGAWGRGAYFADDPRKSHVYTLPNTTTNRRVIFYNKVVLGIESVENKVQDEDDPLVAAPVDHHSVHGLAFAYHEYIVYRYGQALPYLKITYTAP